MQGPTKMAQHAAKLYGTSSDRGVPVTQVKKTQPAVGGKVKKKAVPAKATQTNPKGGV